MGGSETDTPPKAPKTSAAQEQQQPAAVSSSPAPTSSPVTATAVYPDWSGFQGYSPIPPHGYFHSPVASSPQGHPYMWGAQALMPPYGTPPHPYVMYPPGGLYAHPSMPPGSHPFSPYGMPSPNGNAEVSGAVQVGAEADGKSSEGKERSPIKRSKGSLGSLNMITGKTNNDLGKTSGASANGAYSQSGESGSEGTSDSDANSQNDSEPKTSGGLDSVDADASRNGSTACGSQNGLARAPSQGILTMPMMPMPAAGTSVGVTGPTTNLNIGMDYWGTPTPSTTPPIRGKVSANAVTGAVVPSGTSGPREIEPWLHDERELKRQRRKQSNRESARRSRLRKQAECEELALRVDALKEENTSLRTEVERIRNEYDQLLAQNTSLKERLGGTEDANTDKNDQDSGHMDCDAQAGQADS